PELLRDQPADEIDRRAGRQRHDHVDRLAGPRLGLSEGGAEERQREKARGKPMPSLGTGPALPRPALAGRGSAGRVLDQTIHALLRERCGMPWMARQMRSGVAGISMWVTPNSASASTIALITTASAGVVPPSPAGRMPSGWVVEGTSLISVVKNGSMSARGIA